MWQILHSRTFRSLRHRNYRRYFAGQIISFAGSWMQSAALMWFLFDRTGDPRWPSWILVAQVGPTVLLGAWGGSLADRYPRRRVVFWTQSAFLCHALLLAALTACHWTWPALILLLMLLSGVIQAVDLPARLAFVPELVPREDLINAVGLNALLFNSARAIGPALAALIFLAAEQWVARIGSWGWDAVQTAAVVCFTLNAVSFVAVLVALQGIVIDGEQQRRPEAKQSQDLWQGMRYLQHHPRLGLLVFLTLLLCIFGWPLLTLLPAYTRYHLGRGEQTYSGLLALLGTGALSGALTTATFGTAARRRFFLRGGALATTLGLALLTQISSFPGAVLACAAVGFGLILYLSTGQATLQLAAPSEFRGRLMALWAMTLSASAPLGHLLAGQAAAIWGVTTVLSGLSCGCALVTIVLWLLPPIGVREDGELDRKA
ncbi:MAG: MFS transporter [Thermogemmata sp.]|uniref:MFS transporter n=1 Tax=Thermogemmata fonticola TaxID=2755323 RepID=A0A7V8VCK4_9BACT|nr:MFS transporter [Thermogemmata fonticola]MBA2225476.1 MFS transporter [Thermogemmata fonticola]